MPGDIKEVDILIAIQELQEIKGATTRNILTLVRESNCNVTMSDVRGALEKGIEDGYVTLCRRMYSLTVPKKPKRSCKKRSVACLTPRKSRGATPCKSPTPPSKKSCKSPRNRKSKPCQSKQCASIVPDEGGMDVEKPCQSKQCASIVPDEAYNFENEHQGSAESEGCVDEKKTDREKTPEDD